MLSQEIERLNSILKIKLCEIDEWKSKHSKLEISIHEKSGIERELNRLEDLLEFKDNEIEDLRKKINSLDITIEELRSSKGKLFEYQNKIATEIERLNIKVKLSLEEIEEWKHKFFHSNERVIFFYFII